MAVATNLFRRGAVYYFRRRLRWRSGSIQDICLSRRTRCLNIARERAIHLSAACERLRSRLDAAAMGQSPSNGQLREVFNRQLAAERDALHALRYSMAREMRDGDRDFRDSLDIMEPVERLWSTGCLPTTERIEEAGGLEAFLSRASPIWIPLLTTRLP